MIPNKTLIYKLKGRKNISRPRKRWMDKAGTGYKPNL